MQNYPKKAGGDDGSEEARVGVVFCNHLEMDVIHWKEETKMFSRDSIHGDRQQQLRTG